MTDAGLAYLRKLPVINYVDLKETKVTPEGVKQLAADMPQCRITWDGGVIEPTGPPREFGLDFNGESSYVQLPDFVRETSDPLTVEVWVWIEKSGGSRTVISRPILICALGATGSPWQCLFRNPPDRINSDESRTNESWQHLAAVFDGRQGRFYVNGQLQGKQIPLEAALTNYRKTQLLGGNWQWQKEAPQNFLLGRLKEVRISKAAPVYGKLHARPTLCPRPRHAGTLQF